MTANRVGVPGSSILEKLDGYYELKNFKVWSMVPVGRKTIKLKRVVRVKIGQERSTLTHIRINPDSTADSTEIVSVQLTQIRLQRPEGPEYRYNGFRHLICYLKISLTFSLYWNQIDKFEESNENFCEIFQNSVRFFAIVKGSRVTQQSLRSCSKMISS